RGGPSTPGIRHSRLAPCLDGAWPWPSRHGPLATTHPPGAPFTGCRGHRRARCSRLRPPLWRTRRSLWRKAHESDPPPASPPEDNEPSSSKVWVHFDGSEGVVLEQYVDGPSARARVTRCSTPPSA